MRKILFITNGHGEDLVATELIKKLGADYEIKVLPLVGAGAAFEGLNISVLGERKKLASGGFSLRNLSYLLKDLAKGLAGQTLAHIKLLCSLRDHVDLTIAIGDVVPMIGALLVRRPWIFVGVNKSAYYRSFGSNYTLWERWLLQKARKVFVRDKVTETDLRQGTIKVSSAEYVGNPLMDCITPLSPNPFPLSKGEGEKGVGGVIGLLPGTRDDARLNLEDFEKLITEINRQNIDGKNLVFVVATTIKNVPASMKKVSFADLLNQAKLVIGLSGTGNEQAAGCGLPVISFYGRGAQYDKKFAEAQKELLGEALYLIRSNQPETIALAFWQLLNDSAKIKIMAQVGPARMGKSGALDQIAHWLKKAI